MNRKQSVISIIIIGIFFFAVALWGWFRPADDFSLTEKRKLAQFPDVSFRNVLNGSFMKSFESYTLDQFPAREFNRKTAAFMSYYVMNKSDNHDIYLSNGSAAKLDYPLNEDSVIRATERFKYVRDKYFPDADRVFASVIPDKGYFLAKEKSYPAMDYEKLVKVFRENMQYAEYIDIFDTLEANDFYRTDPHWNSVAIYETANKLASAMGKKINRENTKMHNNFDYYGTYAGQSALLMKPDTISFISNEAIENAKVFNHEAGKESSVYDFDKLKERDPYEFFLSGSVSLIEITNDFVKDDSKLIIFRDSFGSSIAPYFIEAYNKIILIDIRYMAPDYLERFVDFSNADILYLYCTSVLNHSETFK